MRFPGSYVLVVSVLAGLSGWAAHLLGKGPGAAVEMLAARNAPGGKTTRKAASRRQSTAVTNLPAKLAQLNGVKLEEEPLEVQLAAWQMIRSLSLKQVKEGLEVTGHEATGDGPNLPAMMLYSRWAELDPEAALNSAAQLPEEGANLLGSGALWTWVQSDPQAAYRWCQHEAKFAETAGLESMMVAMLMKEPPESALEKAALLGDEVRKETMLKLASALANDEESRARFIAMTAGFPEPERKEALQRMAKGWAVSQPEEALASLDRIVAEPGEQQRLRADMLKGWGTREPAESLEWMTRHPDPRSNEDQAMVWKRWATELPAAANAWMESRGNPPALAAEIVRQIQSRTLNTQLGGGARESQRQEEALRRSYRTWAQAEPAEASQWLKSADPEIANAIAGPADESR